MSDHRDDAGEQRRDDIPADDPDIHGNGLDAAASDALEARLEGRPMNPANPAVELRAQQMFEARTALSADSDAPSDARMEGLLNEALQSRTTAEPPAEADEMDSGIAAVALTQRSGNHRRTTAWVLGAAAVLLVALAGVSVVRSSSGTVQDAASRAPAEADTGNSEPADSESADAVPAESEAATSDTPNALEEATGDGPGTESDAATEFRDEVSLAERDLVGVLAGLEFTIVVPVANR